MTSINDRRHKIQRYYTQAVEDAITSTVFGEDNRRIMRSLFLDNATYEATAIDAHLSLRGLHKRVRTIYPPVEKYLKTKYLN